MKSYATGLLSHPFCSTLKTKKMKKKGYINLLKAMQRDCCRILLLRFENKKNKKERIYQFIKSYATGLLSHPFAPL